MKWIRNLLYNFILCGTIGWCLEILFTSFDSFRRRELSLKGNTSIWMFPIYGTAALLMPLSRLLKSSSLWFRGLFYTIAIFTVEYCSGSFLKRHKLCPWDYSRAKLSLHGVIRFDYAPFWFITGLIFESILTKRQKR